LNPFLEVLPILFAGLENSFVRRHRSNSNVRLSFATDRTADHLSDLQKQRILVCVNFVRRPIEYGHEEHKDD
jgi:hypothetical protein